MAVNELNKAGPSRLLRMSPGIIIITGTGRTFFRAGVVSNLLLKLEVSNLKLLALTYYVLLLAMTVFHTLFSRT